jgi:hypothetical protein
MLATMATDGEEWVRRRSFIAPLAAGAVFAIALGSGPASAQTWAEQRTTPRLKEIVAIDRTGEPNWPYGEEDVAGDGLEQFLNPEQSIDVRTVYAAAVGGRLWTRAYVAVATAISPDVRVFVFIDADRNRATGGTAAAPEIDARFTIDSSPGGYEHVLGVKGDGTVAGVWTFGGTPGAYVPVNVPAGQATAEAGVDADPILIAGAAHGYVQGSIELGLVGLDVACDANLYFRSVSDAPSLGQGDLDVGISAPCVPGDGDSDRVPDVIVPPSGCDRDADCAGRGVCASGRCVLPVPCGDDLDCEAGVEECWDDGRCIPVPSGTCSSSDECDGRVCIDGQCAACTLGGSDCGPDARCAPTGVCVPGVDPGAGSSGAGEPWGPGSQPGDEVRGGACACTAGPAPLGGGALLLLAAGGLALSGRRRARRGVEDGR